MDDAYASTPARRLRPLPSRMLSDERLARLAAEGDQAAFTAIYRRYQDPLYRYCRSIVVNPEDARDAFQSTMTSAFRALQGERREITLKAWLYRIAHNEAVSILRRRRPTAELDDAAGVAVADVTADAAVRERLRELVGDMGELAPRHRATLVMRELSGLSYAEIGEALDFSPAAARQTVYEARRALHEMSEGRAMDCDQIRERISATDGRIRRALKVRAHLNACASCRDFQAAIGTRRADLAAIAPPLAPALAASVFGSLFGGGGTAAAKSAGVAAAAGGGNALAGAGALKIVAVAAVTVTAGTAGAGAIADRVGDRSGPGSAPQTREGSRSSDGRGAGPAHEKRTAGADRARRKAAVPRRERQRRQVERRARRRADSGPPAASTRPGGAPIPVPQPGAPRATPRGAPPAAPAPPAPAKPQPAPAPAPAPQTRQQPQAAPEAPAPTPTAPVPEPPSAPVETPRGPAR